MTHNSLNVGIGYLAGAASPSPPSTSPNGGGVHAGSSQAHLPPSPQWSSGGHRRPGPGRRHAVRVHPQRLDL